MNQRLGPSLHQLNSPEEQLLRAQAYTAQARRLYQHVMLGSALSVQDVQRLVAYLEEKDQLILDLLSQLPGNTQVQGCGPLGEFGVAG